MTKKERLMMIINHYSNGKPTSFAKLLGVAPSTISSWMARDTIDYDLLFAKCETLNPAWLLTGEGEMLRNPYLEKPNDIVSDIEYKSPNFDRESLLRIGIRVSEVARIYKLSQQELADRIDMDYEELMAIANADQSATPALIIKLAAAFPDLNPYWLSTGQSAPLIKDVLPEFAINELPAKLAAAEKQLKEKDFIISLQKDTIESQKETIESLKKQATLLEEKTATPHYPIPSKNAASSKGKAASGTARDITLG